MSTLSPAMGTAYAIAFILAGLTTPLYFQRRAKWMRMPFIAAPWLMFVATFPELYGGWTPMTVVVVCWILTGAHIAYSLFCPKYYTMFGSLRANFSAGDRSSGAFPQGIDQDDLDRVKKFHADCLEADRRREERRKARGKSI